MDCYSPQAKPMLRRRLEPKGLFARHDYSVAVAALCGLLLPAILLGIVFYRLVRYREPFR
jgi:hypothetical protein